MDHIIYHPSNLVQKKYSKEINVHLQIDNKKLADHKITSKDLSLNNNKYVMVSHVKKGFPQILI